MADIKKVFWEIIKILDKNKILDHVVLVGSWAEYVYEISGYFKDFEANLKTRDIDFLVRNINKPREKINIIEVLEGEGFDTSIDYISNTYKFFRGKDLEVEFLVREMGEGRTGAYDVPSFGIKAEGLRHTGILINNSFSVKIEDIEITVPAPQAYVLQKIIIHKRRMNKADKDYLSIENLWDYITASMSESKKLKALFEKLSSKQKRTVKEYLENNLLQF
jgi:hypothetical protein